MLNAQLNDDDFAEVEIYLTFSYGKKRYCTSVCQVKEIVDLPVIVPMPVDMDQTIGIFNLRGVVIPVADPFNFFQKDLAEKGPQFLKYLSSMKTRLMIFDINHDYIALPVTEVNKVELAPNTFAHDTFIKLNGIPFENFEVSKILEKN